MPAAATAGIALESPDNAGDLWLLPFGGKGKRRRYLLSQRFGHAARRAFLRDLAAGRFVVAGLDREDYATIVGLEARYADLHLGLADCALVVLADRYRTERILSFDERTSEPSRPCADKRSQSSQLTLDTTTTQPADSSGATASCTISARPKRFWRPRSTTPSSRWPSVASLPPASTRRFSPMPA